MFRPLEGRGRMRVLMVCMQYPLGPGQSYMTTELADALSALGHVVEVLHLDWQGEAGSRPEVVRTGTGVRVVRCGPKSLEGLGHLVKGASKFVLSSAQVAQVARRYFELDRFDAAIAWAPASAVASLPPLFRRARIPHRLLFIWDFFPDHHREIGRIPGGPAFWIARASEQHLMSQFTAVICTLAGNADYLRRNFRLGRSQRVLVTPIWSETAPRPPVDRAAVRARHGLPPDRPIAVFGGQLVEGRGFDQMLDAAYWGRMTGSQLLYLFVGDGRLAPMVREAAEREPNVAWRPAMAREDYLELLGACDVGMVATVPGVTSFSIPTKTIDYLRAGLPVAAAVERGSDFISILDRYGVGRATPFQAPLAFHRATEQLALDLEARAAARRAGPRCLDEVFDVRHAVSTVLSAVSQPPPAAAETGGVRAAASRRVDEVFDVRHAARTVLEAAPD
jgi:glycosyltransferase involved in cell wall biosynthesis